MVMSSHGAEQLIVQRVLACKTVADGRKALVLSAVVIFPLFLIFLLVGAMLWVFYQGHPFQIPLPETRPGSGITANDFIFPIFMMTEVPHVLKGFFIVAILSAAMSSVSSALTSLASVSTMDFVKHVLPQRSELFFLRFSKISTVVWAAALILLASLSRQVPFVLNAAFSLRGLTSGALLGGLALAVFWRKGRATPVIVGMLSSLATMTAIQVLPKFDWAKEPCRGIFSRCYLTGVADGLQWAKDLWMRTIGAEIFWPWYTLIGVTITLSTAWLLRNWLGRRADATPPQEQPPQSQTKCG